MTLYEKIRQYESFIKLVGEFNTKSVELVFGESSIFNIAEYLVIFEALKDFGKNSKERGTFNLFLSANHKELQMIKNASEVEYGISGFFDNDEDDFALL
jgi:hypothetical protein